MSDIGKHIVINHAWSKSQLVKFIQKYTGYDLSSSENLASKFPVMLNPDSEAELISMKEELKDMRASFEIFGGPMPPPLVGVNALWPVMNEIVAAKVIEYINVADKKRSQIMWSGVATIVANTLGGSNLSNVAVGGTGMAMAATMGDTVVMEVSFKNNKKWKVIMTINEYTIFTNELKRIKENSNSQIYKEGHGVSSN